MSSGPITWNSETGLKMKVAGPLAEKSYRVDTAEELSLIEVTNVASGLIPYHCAR